MKRGRVPFAVALMVVAFGVPPVLAQDPDVRELITKLEGKDGTARIEAAKSLMALGPRAKDAVPALVKALEDENPVVRQKVVIALGLIHASPELSVPALRKAIKDKAVLPKGEGTSVDRAAIGALAYFGLQAKDAVPDLLELAQGEDHDLKVLAFGSLASIRSNPEKVIPLLTDILKGKNDRFLKSTAATVLACYGPDPKTVDLLRNAYSCEDVDDAYRKGYIQFSIVQAMGRMGPYAKPHLSWLLEIFKDLNRPGTVRQAAVQAFGDLGPHAKAAIPGLIECLNDRKHWGADATELINALAKIGEDAVEPLVKNLGHPEADARSLTVQALGAMGPKAAAAIPALEKAALDGDSGVSRHAAIALEQIKAPQKPN